MFLSFQKGTYSTDVLEPRTVTGSGMFRHLVCLVLLPIKGKKYLVLVSGGLSLWTGWPKNACKGPGTIKLPVAGRGSLKSVLKFPNIL